MKDDKSGETKVFDSYWKRVRSELGLPLNGRQNFIRDETISLLNRDWQMLDGAHMVQRLFESMESGGWKETPGLNWVWREKHSKPSENNKSQEVLLEHEIVETGHKRWARQISTASGVDIKPDGTRTRTNRRRAIDLVYDQGDGGFSFVELKVGSDSPIYALFEILGYGLAYWHSRLKKLNHRPDALRLIRATKIDLLVLGPESWYDNNPPDMAIQTRVALETLVAKLNHGLDTLTQGAPPMRLSCRKFPLADLTNAVPAAESAIKAVMMLPAD